MTTNDIAFIGIGLFLVLEAIGILYVWAWLNKLDKAYRGFSARLSNNINLPDAYARTEWIGPPRSRSRK